VKNGGLFFFEISLNKWECVMSGTVKGGRAAAQSNRKKYGPDFYARIGAIGGRKGHTGGFYANRELARVAGARGGRVSRRGKKVTGDEQQAA
jgi:hypothetical protein